MDPFGPGPEGFHQHSHVGTNKQVAKHVTAPALRENTLRSKGVLLIY